MDTRIRLGIIGAAAAAVLSIALGVPGNAGAQPQQAGQQAPAEQAQPVTVNVDLDEWGVLPSVRSVAAGVPVRFVARNIGGVSHQFQLTATGLPNVQSAVLAPGESYAIDLVFGAAFNAQLLCPIGNAERDEPVPGPSHRQRGMETAFTVTAPPAGVTIQATPAIPPAPTIQALTAPGANVDRVGLPENYQQRFQTFYVFDRPDNRQVRHIFANAQAMAAQPNRPFPYGSVLVMETWRAKLTPDNQLALDANGRYQKDEIAGLFVMRKEPGFGAKYGPDRTGEWEYVAYQPATGALATTPERSQACAQCHLTTSDAQRDWVERANLFFAQRLSLLRLPATGGHDLAGLPRPAINLAPFALAALAPALGVAGLALRSLVRRR